MIIQSLVDYYGQLRENPDSGIADLGWCSRQVRFLLELSPEGRLKAVIPCGDGKHGVSKVVPEPPKRSNGVAPSFLCDNSSYFLGFDAKDDPERTEKCFEASRDLHLSLLEGCDGTVARAIAAFFMKWDPAHIDFDAVPGLDDEGVLAGGSLAICVSQGPSWVEACDDEEIRAAWDSCLVVDDTEKEMVSLVTGKRSPVARLHPSIKGIAGAQPSGASLVVFNDESFESYGHAGEQGRNAPVDVASVQAYGIALNYMTVGRDHRGKLGDTTVAFWSSKQDFDEGNCSVLSVALGFAPISEGESRFEAEQKVKAVLDRVAAGKHIDLDGVSLDEEFFLLGLAPNSSRLAVRFFLHGSFGDMVRHVADHYRISDVAHAPYEHPFVSPYWLLDSLERPKSKKANDRETFTDSKLSAPLMRAILLGARYPESLYQNALLRVRAERTVKREHAALIRAYLIRNANKSESEVTVDMNEENKDVAYTLGRAFYVLERIQEAANDKATVAERYLSSASAMPATTFPVLLRLSVSHLKKIARDKPGLADFLEKQLGELMAQQGADFPKRLSLIDQGSFLLGYYQQKQARYKKKDDQEEQN